MKTRNFKPFIETKLDRALDAVCQIEDITSFDYGKRTDEHNVLYFEVTLCRQLEDDITIQFPVLHVATQSSQWITCQILIACGWTKEETEVYQ